MTYLLDTILMVKLIAMSNAQTLSKFSVDFLHTFVKHWQMNRHTTERHNVMMRWPSFPTVVTSYLAPTYQPLFYIGSYVLWLAG